MIYELDDAYAVRPLRPADIDGPYPTWFEDQEVCRYNSHGKFFRQRQYFEAYVAGTAEEDRIVWAICHRSDGHVGNVALLDISFLNRTAEFAILLGDRRHWGKGLGTLAGRALLKHGFTKLNLERIYCGTAASNMAMRRLAASLGMKEEGRRRSHLWVDGARVDQIDFGVLRDEFSALGGRGE